MEASMQEIRSYTKRIDSFWAELSKIYKEWAKKNGMDYYEFSILYEISQCEKITQKEICEAYNYPKQSINNVALELGRKGLIEFIPSEKDKREKQMVLSDKGKVFSERVFTPLFKIEENIYKKVGAESIEKMLEIAEKYVKCVEEEMSDGK